ncbi:hypothetical protein [Yinghuangia sp. YIM S10712]|uniref:hypothetical protein n=1 Tax=Yinghuangia sp. YIM S10712 TaxID=3436930 RepID=UPI003F53BC59
MRTLSEFESAQNKRLLRAIDEGAGADREVSIDNPVLRFSLDGPAVQDHRIESGLLGDWLKYFQAAVQSVAYALDELRPTHDSGPVPKEIQKLTKLYSGPVFASSYGMVLEGRAGIGQEEIPGVGNNEGLLDRTINRILDLTDSAGSGPAAEDAVLDVAIPLGRRAIRHLAELSNVLAQAEADVTLTWHSQSTVSRTSRLSSDNADRCRRALRADDLEDRTERFRGIVVGGSKIRGVIEIELERGDVIVVRTSKQEVTALLGAHAERGVEAEVHVLTARSPLGREHHSYTLVGISSADD